MSLWKYIYNVDVNWGLNIFINFRFSKASKKKTNALF